MGRGLAVNTAKRVRLAVSDPSAYTMPKVLGTARNFDYERVSVAGGSGPADSSISSRSARPVKLGNRGRMRISGLQGLLLTPGSLFSKLRASYGKLRETARENNVNVYDLFVGNHCLMHICATPTRWPEPKAKPATPPPQASTPKKVVPKSHRLGPSRPAPSRPAPPRRR